MQNEQLAKELKDSQSQAETDRHQRLECEGEMVRQLEETKTGQDSETKKMIQNLNERMESLKKEQESMEKECGVKSEILHKQKSECNMEGQGLRETIKGLQEQILRDKDSHVKEMNELKEKSLKETE